MERIWQRSGTVGVGLGVCKGRFGNPEAILNKSSAPVDDLDETYIGVDQESRASKGEKIILYENLDIYFLS